MRIETIMQIGLMILSLAVFTVILIYLGIKIKKLPLINKIQWKKIIYILFFIFLLIFSYFIAGRITFIFLMYSVVLFFIFDIIWFVLKHSNSRMKVIIKRLYLDGLSVLVMAAIICLFGFVTTKQIKFTKYNVDLESELGEFDSVDIFLVSDLHVGTMIKEKELNLLLKKIQEVQPDMVVLCGDIFDENSPNHLIQYAYDIFDQISTPLGIYYVFGNHEIYRYNLESITNELTNRGVTVLKDEAVLIKDSFYVVGRMDAAVTRGVKTRKSIDTLVNSLDKRKPIIVLDHQPLEYTENEKSQVDLILSGHTHAGQVFPITIFSSLVNEMNYGYEKRGTLHAIVTSGMGTWGFPIRLGTSSEMVLVHVE